MAAHRFPEGGNVDARDGAFDEAQDHLQDEMQECVEQCMNCEAVCTVTMQHCLATGGAHADVNLVGTLLDCADLAGTAAAFMLRGSPYHVITCGACAELCRACAEACRSISADDQLADCADVCAECAARCDRMARLGSDE